MACVLERTSKREGLVRAGNRDSLGKGAVGWAMMGKDNIDGLGLSVVILFCFRRD